MRAIAKLVEKQSWHLNVASLSLGKINAEAYPIEKAKLVSVKSEGVVPATTPINSSAQ